MTRGEVTMDQIELDFIKRIFRDKDEATKELWLEKQLLRNLVLDSGWMGEQELDLAIAEAKKSPENLRQVAEHFASSDQMLAEIGLAGWLREFDKKYPHND